MALLTLLPDSSPPPVSSLNHRTSWHAPRWGVGLLVPLLALCWFLAQLLTSSSTQAQANTDEEFHSGGGMTWWDVKRRDYPSCSGLVDQHEEMTRELYRLDAEAKGTVDPRHKQLVREINNLSRKRTAVQKQIFACIRISSQPDPGKTPPLEGHVEITDEAPAPPNEVPPTKKIPPFGGPGPGVYSSGQPDPVLMFADGASKGVAECFEQDLSPENVVTGALLGRLKKFERAGKAVMLLGKANNLASIYEQLRQFNPNMNDYQLGKYLATLLCEGRDLADIDPRKRPGSPASTTNTGSQKPSEPVPGKQTGDAGDGGGKKPPNGTGGGDGEKGMSPEESKNPIKAAPDPLRRGMPLEDHKQLTKLAVSEKKLILVRDSNPWAMRWVGRPRHQPKPQNLKAKTIRHDPTQSAEGNQYAGLASAEGLSDADRRDILKRGYSIRGERQLIVDPKGNRLYSDTDLHGVYDLNGKDAWSGSLKEKMNDSFLENMVQHGPHDNWDIRNDKDLAGPNAGPHAPVTAYLPDGSAQHLETVEHMKEFYLKHGMDWNSLYPGY